jgi:queuine tRNA-ribosyltransferase
MGLGDPVGIIEAVALGVDMMDCVLPTRLARHGTLLTDAGKTNIRRAEYARSTDPIDPTCPCDVCARYSKGYLRHLVSVGEPTGATLCTLHNVAWLLRFMDRIRAAIAAGTLDALRSEVSAVWS